MSAIRVLVLAAIVIQCAVAIGALIVRTSFRSRFMRTGMMLSVAAATAVSAAVLVSLWPPRAYSASEYVLAGLTLVLSVAESFGVAVLVRYVRTQQRHEDELAAASETLLAHRDEMERSRDFYLQLFDDFPALIWRADTSAQCDYFNRAWLEFRGRTTEQERGDGWTSGVHPDDLDRCVGVWMEAFAGREAFEMEYRLQNSEGEYRWIADYGRPFSAPDGTFLGYIGSCYDITQAKEQADRLTYLADHDALTGLANRRVLQSALERAHARAQRGVPGLLLFIDVDHFKAINDRMGHPAGDSVLVSVARLLTAGTRATDVVARLGGDEFAILLEMTQTDEAVAIAERLVDDTRSRLADTGLSIGVAALGGTDDVTEVMRRADESMYDAKRGGGGRVVVDIRAANTSI